MAKYIINKIGFCGREEFAMEVEANSLTAAWLGTKFWFSNGSYHVFPKGNKRMGARFEK